MNNCSLNPEVRFHKSLYNANESNIYITGGEVAADGEYVWLRNCTFRYAKDVDKEQQQEEQYKHYPNKDIAKVRSDSNFSHLKDITKLETLIGTNIPLPELMYYPKDFDSSTPFLLTRQRFNLLKKIINKTLDGYFLSGPQGVSKSYSMYFIACYAVVNSIPLLYNPKCVSWVRAFFNEGKEGAEQFLLKLIQHWNYDILLPNELSALTESTDMIETLVQIVENRGKQEKDSQLFLLFDEHNELFKADEEGKTPITCRYFSQYRGWGSLRISNKYTYILTVYCGSAHSSFEDNLLGRIVRVKPPTQQEFDILVANYGLDPKDKNISFATGRMPRELRILCSFLEENNSSILTQKLLSIFTKRQRKQYMSRILRLQDQLKKEGKIGLFNQTLEDIFGIGFNDNDFSSSVIGLVYDQGLLYIDESEELIPINESAKRVLFHLYCTVEESALTISNRISTEEQGYVFQRLIKKQEFIHGSRSGKYRITKEKSLTQQLQYQVNGHVCFNLDNLGSLKLDYLVDSSTILYIPEDLKFPCFDYMIISFGKSVRLIFKQATISTIQSHYKGNTKTTDIDRLLKRVYLVNDKKQAILKNNEIDIYPVMYHYSLLEIVIHGIFGFFKTPTIVTVKDNSFPLIARDISANVIAKNKLVSHLNVTFENGNTFELEWYYVYELGSSNNKQKVGKVQEQGILFRTKEDIEKEFMIHIEE